MTPPYRTPTGIQIGLLHKRPMPKIYGDAFKLQSALIDKRTAQPLNAAQRLACWLWRWA